MWREWSCATPRLSGGAAGLSTKTSPHLPSPSFLILLLSPPPLPPVYAWRMDVFPRPVPGASNPSLLAYPSLRGYGRRMCKALLRNRRLLSFLSYKKKKNKKNPLEVGGACYSPAARILAPGMGGHETSMSHARVGGVGGGMIWRLLPLRNRARARARAREGSASAALRA